MMLWIRLANNAIFIYPFVYLFMFLFIQIQNIFVLAIIVQGIHDWQDLNRMKSSLISTCYDWHMSVHFKPLLTADSDHFVSFRCLAVNMIKESSPIPTPYLSSNCNSNFTYEVLITVGQGSSAKCSLFLF